MLDPSGERRMARLLRIAVITQQHQIGNLTKEEAVSLLRGPLTPGDDTTIVDDSALLCLPLATIMERLEETP
jgi:hypothetical protein